EGDRFTAVDEAVVVGEGDVHHRPDDHLAVDGDGSILDGVQAEDAGLGRVDDGGGQQRAVDAAVGNGERTAFELVQFELVVLGAFGKIGDRQFDLGERHAVGVAEDGDDQPAAAADGDADVVVVPVDDL